MARLDELFADKLAALARAGRRRTLTPVAQTAPARLLRDGQPLIDFSSNDYLGLATHPALIEGARAAAARYGTGAGASRLVTGTHDLHLEIESRIAALKGQEAALILASGWQANASILPALLRATGPETTLFSDALNHASLIHGIRAAGIKPTIYPHNDLTALDASLAAAPPGPKIIVTESVFSMDGDTPDLPRLRALADRHDAFLYLDEAHATGALGPAGAGLSHLAAPDLVMGTFSKALGSFGAFVAGSRPLIDYLTNACSGFVYTTALPPPVLGAITAALDLLPTLDEARTRLATNATRLRTELAALGIDTAASTTQIIPAIIGEESAALTLATHLREAGLLAIPIRPPTVPPGTSRLRVALSAAHTDADLEQLAAAMKSLWLHRAA